MPEFYKHNAVTPLEQLSNQKHKLVLLFYFYSTLKKARIAMTSFNLLFILSKGYDNTFS
jgi:hypothetical protein